MRRTDRRTGGQNYDSQNRASVAAWLRRAVKMLQHNANKTPHTLVTSMWEFVLGLYCIYLFTLKTDLALMTLSNVSGSQEHCNLRLVQTKSTKSDIRTVRLTGCTMRILTDSFRTLRTSANFILCHCLKNCLNFIIKCLNFAATPWGRKQTIFFFVHLFKYFTETAWWLFHIH